MLDRRNFMLAASGAIVAATTGCTKEKPVEVQDFGGVSFDKAIAAIEMDSGGRLGVAIRDLQTGRAYAHRGDERFPMCSTFKFLLAAATLSRVDKRQEQLDRQIVYGRDVLLDVSPVTEKHVDKGMTVAALCEATIIYSDNAAANLLLPGIGGSAGFTSYARSLGDESSRLDRNEPALGEAVPGDPRDTTTPRAMLGNLDRVLLGDALSSASRALLTGWLVANMTGDTRLRAGLPGDWKVGDKTGSGAYGSTNDIAILWPPRRKPILITTYLTETEAPAERRSATIAAVGRAVVDATPEARRTARRATWVG